MDVLALDHKHSLPALLTPHGGRRLMFPYWHTLIWGVWVLSLAVLLGTAWRRRALLRAVLRRSS
jgi:hypothetical protein